MLSGFDEDVVAIRNNLNSHIALEIITLLSEDYNGFSKVTYDFSTSWYFNSGGGLEVLMSKYTPEDIAESGMVWE